MNKVEKRLRDVGVDYDLFIDKHKLLHAIPFILNELANSIQEDYMKAGLFRHKIKYNLNPVINKSDAYDRYFWREIAGKSELAAKQYGELAENLFEKLITERELWKSYVKE